MEIKEKSPIIGVDIDKIHKVWEEELGGVIAKHSKTKFIEILKDENALNEMWNNKQSLKDYLSDKHPELLNDELKPLIESFSGALEYITKKKIIRNPDFGLNKIKEADQFAKNMIDILEQVRDEGITTTRGISERLNKLDIKSARGGEWSHTAVGNLMKRLVNLDMIEGVKDTVTFAKDMRANLQKVKDEGITTTRGIAKKFNELGLKTARGKDFSHIAVFRLIEKCKELDLEGNKSEDDNTLTAE